MKNAQSNLGIVHNAEEILEKKNQIVLAKKAILKEMMIVQVNKLFLIIIELR